MRKDGSVVCRPFHICCLQLYLYKFVRGGASSSTSYRPGVLIPRMPWLNEDNKSVSRMPISVRFYGHVAIIMFGVKRKWVKGFPSSWDIIKPNLFIERYHRPQNRGEEGTMATTRWQIKLEKSGAKPAISELKWFTFDSRKCRAQSSRLGLSKKHRFCCVVATSIANNNPSNNILI